MSETTPNRGNSGAATGSAHPQCPVEVTTDNAPRSSGPVSQAVIALGFAFVSGQLPIDPGTKQIQTGFAAQARQVLDNVKAVVEAAGSSMDHVVRATIYLTDIHNKGAFNEIYAQYFPNGKPARALVEVSAIDEGIEVEMDAIAVIPSTGDGA